MTRTFKWIAPAAFIAVAAVWALGSRASAEDKPAAAPPSAVCVLQATSGSSVKGVVKFTEAGGKVKVSAHVEGLTPNQKHAIHVHEFGDATSADGKSAGGHYNPEGHNHALPESAQRHAGDLGNLTADAKGVADYEITVDNLTVNGAKNPVIGRSVIVHAKVDDGGQPTGNAGDRIACGVIGLANTAAK